MVSFEISLTFVFKKGTRKEDQLIGTIKDIIRLNQCTLDFKETDNNSNGYMGHQGSYLLMFLKLYS